MESISIGWILLYSALGLGCVIMAWRVRKLRNEWKELQEEQKKEEESKKSS